MRGGMAGRESNRGVSEWGGRGEEKSARISSNLRVLKKFIEMFGVEKGKVANVKINCFRAWERNSVQNYSTYLRNKKKRRKKGEKRERERKVYICRRQQAGGCGVAFCDQTEGYFYPFIFFCHFFGQRVLPDSDWYLRAIRQKPIEMAKQRGGVFFSPRACSIRILADTLMRDGGELLMAALLRIDLPRVTSQTIDRHVFWFTFLGNVLLQ